MKTHMFRNSISTLFGMAALALVSGEGLAQSSLTDGAYDEIRVVSSALDAPKFKLLSTVELIERGEIESHLTDTIGDLVSRYPGVDNAGMGYSVGRPVIRGQGDYRIAVLENGFTAGDVSRTGGDHANAVSLLDVQRVEIVKGPAGLRYGPYVSSGVINLLDVHMTPEMRPTSRYEIMESFSDMSGEKSVAFLGRQSFLIGDTRALLAVSGRSLDRDAYEIPGTMESLALLEEEGEDVDDAKRGLAENTDIEEEGGTVSLNLGKEGNLLSLMFSTLNREYGLVGHHHEEEEGGEEEHEEEAAPRIDMKRDVFRGRYSRHVDGIVDRFSISFGMTDYEHVEKEGGEAAAKFALTDAYSGNLEMTFDEIEGLETVVGYTIEKETLETSGEEAFLPETETTRQAVYAFDKYEHDKWIFEFSARMDEVEHKTATAEYDSSANSLAGGLAYQTPYAGIVGVTYADAKRLPTVNELYADGVHFAAQRNENGNDSLTREKSNMVEVYFRQIMPFGGFNISYYENTVDDYIFLTPTGADDSEGFGIFNYTQGDAEFTGAEMTIYWSDIQLWNTEVNADLTFDNVRGSLAGGGAIPNLSPVRIIADADVAYKNLDFGVRVTHAAEQKRVASYELPTDEYTQLDLEIGWSPEVLKDGRVALMAKNVTDEEVRRHVSPFKDRVSEPGQDITLRLHLTF